MNIISENDSDIKKEIYGRSSFAVFSFKLVLTFFS